MNTAILDQVVRQQEDIEALRRQLTSQGEVLVAALVAIKLKDKALELIALDDCCTSPAPIAQEALAIQPDDSALKAWIGEPVAWKDANDEMLFHSHDLPTDIPLYAPKGLK